MAYRSLRKNRIEPKFLNENLIKAEKEMPSFIIPDQAFKNFEVIVSAFESSLIPLQKACVDVSESSRILRANHEFGIIGDVIVSNPPTNGRLQRLYEESLGRLEVEETTNR